MEPRPDLAPSGDRGATRLYGIEALRGLAAVSVVLYHVARHVDKALHAPGLARVFQAGHAGVDLFFVISGFIILYVHRGDINRPDRLTHYATRRLNRILPLYWVTLCLTVLLTAVHHGLPDLGRFVWSATLLPNFDEPILGIAWTLQFEMVFYIVFAVLISNIRVGLVLLLLWQGCALAGAAGLVSLPLPTPFWGGYCLEFLMGMTAAWWLNNRRFGRPRLLATFGVVLFSASFVLECRGTLDGYGAGGRLAYGLPASLTILGLAASERAGVLAIPEWLRRIGNASYSIYLFQFVFIGLAWQALLAGHTDRMPPPVVLFVLFSAAALAGGVAMSRLVERPLLRLARLNWRTSSRLA